VPIGKSTLLIELQRPTGAGYVIGARVASENGEQAAVRGEMRRDQIDRDEQQESCTKSKDEAFGHGDVPTILKD